MRIVVGVCAMQVRECEAKTEQQTRPYQINGGSLFAANIAARKSIEKESRIIQHQRQPWHVNARTFGTVMQIKNKDIPSLPQISTHPSSYLGP